MYLDNPDKKSIIKDIRKSTIHVEFLTAFVQKDYSTNRYVIGVQSNTQSYKYDGTAIPKEGIITSTPEEVAATQDAKKYLDSPSNSFGEGVVKAAANIGYSIVNSPYSLITKEDLLTGAENTFDDNMNAFIDVAPGAVLKGAVAVGNVIKTEGKGLKAYNNYVEKRGTGTFTGEGWQKDASKSFKANKTAQEAVRTGDNSIDAVNNTVAPIKKEIEK